jgi:homoserine dehydrogenase
VNPVKVGIAGLGTVGSGTVNILRRNADEIARRVGRPIEIAHIGARRDNPACDVSGIRVSRDVMEVARDPQIDIVVELIGGTTQPVSWSSPRLPMASMWSPPTRR